jgi:hypothetical protein
MVAADQDDLGGTGIAMRGRFYLFGFLGLLILAAGVYLGFSSFLSVLDPEGEAEEDAVPSTLPILKLGTRHQFPEIRFPHYVSVQEVEKTFRPDEPVLGLVLHGEVRTYSIDQLNRNEMVVDELAGVPILVTYCPLCRTGIVYDRRVRGEVLDFGHRGWLYEESFMFFDTQTDSLWVQATGEAVHGAYKGTLLERLPATQTTWDLWLKQHPETLVLARPAGMGEGYRPDRKEDPGTVNRGPASNPQATRGIGLAVFLPGQQKLYPFRELAKQPAVIDLIGDQRVLVVYHAARQTAVAFEYRPAGGGFKFSPPLVTAVDVILTDEQTGSTWSGMTGRCLQGPAKGTRLQQLPTTQFVEGIWPRHFPGAPVYQFPF